MKQVEIEKKKYKCKCPICGCEFFAQKSLFQEMFKEIDMGHGSCPDCKEFLNLKVDEENECMIVTPWEEYIKQNSQREGA